MRFSVLSSIGLTLLLPAPRASACSALACFEPAIYPASATIPANVGGVWLDEGASYDGAPTELTLTITPPGGAASPLTHVVVDRALPPHSRQQIRFDVESAIGATVTLSATLDCTGLEPLAAERSWTVVAAAPRPSALGTVDVDVDPSGMASMPDSHGACSVEVPTAVAIVALDTDASLDPWLDVVAFETVVDGEIWNPEVTISPFNAYSRYVGFGGSWVGRGSDKIFARCGELEEGVSEGTHAVVMRGALPDGTVLESAPVEFALSCALVGSEGEGDGEGEEVDGTGGPAPEASRCDLAFHRDPSALAALASALAVIALRRRSATTRACARRSSAR